MLDASRRQILAAASGSLASALLHSPSFSQTGLLPPSTSANQPREDITDIEWAQSVALSEGRDGVSLLVEQSGTVLREAYSTPGGINRASNLFSGTKGLTSLYAAILVADGLLDLDEPVSETLAQWRNDPRKRLITPYHLLSMTSGIASRNQYYLDAPLEALNRPCVADPGTSFMYGPAPVQCFAALVTAKLAASGAAITDPQADLTRRLLAPLGITPQRWDRTRGGAPVMVVNCYLTAREWARVGRFVLDGGRVNGRQLCDPAALARALTPSEQNICFGMSWWVSGPRSQSRHLFEANSVQLTTAHGLYGQIWTSGGYYAQRLILLPKRDLIIVRQARGVFGAAVAKDFFGQRVEMLSELKLVQEILDMTPEATAS
jgi:CubicO group peptidase (beta-lactamase class C family)